MGDVEEPFRVSSELKDKVKRKRKVLRYALDDKSRARCIDACSARWDQLLHNTMKVQRAIRDLTQADLAEMAGVTRKSVNAIETGRMVPSVLLALKLARAGCISRNYF